MAIHTDEIANEAGTGPVDLIGQSAAKAWGRADSTFTLNNSLNISSTDDNGTGDMDWNFTNSFQGSESYSAQTNVGTNSTRFIGSATLADYVNVTIFNEAPSARDEINMITCNGTLA